jgi:hypothetical protein
MFNKREARKRYAVQDGRWLQLDNQCLLYLILEKQAALKKLFNYPDGNRTAFQAVRKDDGKKNGVLIHGPRPDVIGLSTPPSTLFF